MASQVTHEPPSSGEEQPGDGPVPGKPRMSFRKRCIFAGLLLMGPIFLISAIAPILIREKTGYLELHSGRVRHETLFFGLLSRSIEETTWFTEVLPPSVNNATPTWVCVYSNEVDVWYWWPMGMHGQMLWGQAYSEMESLNLLCWAYEVSDSVRVKIALDMTNIWLRNADPKDGTEYFQRLSNECLSKIRTADLPQFWDRMVKAPVGEIPNVNPGSEHDHDNSR